MKQTPINEASFTQVNDPLYLESTTTTNQKLSASTNHETPLPGIAKTTHV